MKPSKKSVNPNRTQWLFTVLLISGLIFVSLNHSVDPKREQERLFQAAIEVPISEITNGYAAKNIQENNN
jgi:hypothetical protein